MAILNNNPLIGAGGNQGYNINNSLRFRSSASANLQRTPASATNRRTWTWSAWVKRGTIGSITQGLFMGNFDGNDNSTYFGFSGDQFFFFNRLLTVANGNIYTTAVYRDPSAWYHIVVAMDTTQATAANRFKLYVNGNQVTSFAIETYPTQNTDMYINSNVQHNIGFRRDGSTNNYFDGYLADVNFIDGQALTPSSFGETDTTTGVWKPKAYSGTYGTNGFYLKFSDIATTSGSNAGLGKDFSGNSNYWTTNNISVTSGTTYDAMTDVPTNTSATVANYCVLNPLLSTSYQTLSNANLTSTNNNSADNGNTYSSIPTGFSGKWYCEFKTINASSGYPTVGTRDVAITTRPINGAYGSIGGDPIGGSSGSVGYRANGDKSINGNATAYGSSYTDSDTIGIAVDADNGAIYFSKNGTWQNSGDPTSGATKTGAANTWTGGSQSFYIGASIYPSGNGVHFNFGQRPFAYTPPTGYKALNTFNLPTSTILQGNTNFNILTWTGTGTSSGRSFTGVGFAPDLVWAKPRSVAYDHNLNDKVRGANKRLRSNTTDAENTNDTYGYLSSFDSDGWTTVSGATENSNWNQTSATYVAWCWKANGAGVTNTSGSITSTVSVNTTAGFSIVTYTGTGANATVGHGLGVAPAMVIVKRRNSTGNWNVRHVSITAANSLYLNLTNASQSDPTVWNSTVPTSTVFSIGTDTGVNASGGTYVGYCWADVSGYSKAFSYTGNGSSDGPFTFLGLRPKFVLIKRTDAVSSWFIHDTSRDTYNTTVLNLYPNLSAAEETQTTYSFDILSNGFKVRGTSTEINASGGTYIGIAFAENPFKVSLAR